MVPHLTNAELDRLMSWKGKNSTDDMYIELASSRDAQGIAPVCISSIRKALNGVTHRRGRSESRGRRRKVRKRGVEASDRTRRRLLVKASEEEEASWAQVIKSSRVKPVDPTTARRRLAAAGKDVKFRWPRAKPERTADDMVQRVVK